MGSRSIYNLSKTAGYIKYQAMHLGSVKVLDEFTVVTDVKYSTNNVLIPVMGLRDVRIRTGILLEHETF